MDDLTIFIIGCGVSFLFCGGVLIHVVASQKVTDVDEVHAEDEAKGPDSSD